MSFLLLYCDDRIHIFALTATLAVVLYVPETFVYMKTISEVQIFVNFLITMMFFAGATMIAMVLIYISRLHCQLEQTNEQNVSLLNGMHEGVLIFKQNEAKVSEIMFCNRPVKKLFHRFAPGAS